MNIKNNKGITLSTTIIAVILLITIMSSIIYSASKVLETKAATQLNNDIAELSRKVNLYYLQNGIVPIDQASGVIYEDSNDAKYYRLIISAIENVNLKNQEEKDKDGNIIKCYVINYETHTIYYVRNEGGTWKPVEYKYVEGYDEFIEKAQTAIKFNKQVTDNEIALNSPVFPQIGDYVNYTYDEANNYVIATTESGYSSKQTINQTKGLNWRFLGYDNNGNIELISETITDKLVYFKGVTGYNNGVFLLNDICKEHYSNSELEIISRSLNIEDIEKQHTDDYIYKNGQGVYKGEKIEYTNLNIYYPNLYEEESGSGVTGVIREDGIGQSDSFYNNRVELVTGNIKKSEGKLLVTNTYYTKEKEKNSEYKNKTFYDMIFLGTNKNTMKYWLASRYLTVANKDYPSYGIRIIQGNEMFGNYMLLSETNSGSFGNYLRPIVTIPADKYYLSQNEEDGSWDIYYKETENKVFE